MNKTGGIPLNIFDALNIFYKEDTISDFLVSCFKDSPKFLIQFLKAANIHVQENMIFHIDTRVGLGKSIGTPDIVIRAKINSTMKFIIIENKMGAAEGYEQTNRYESTEARTRIASRYGVEVENIEFYFIFLALDTTAKPKNSKFTFLSYQIFLNNTWTLNNTTLQLLFDGFKEKLSNFYEPIHRPYETLESKASIDSLQRKICWQMILTEQFSSEQNLVLDWGEVGGSGRNNFLFLITKSAWKSRIPFHQAGLAQTFYIHVDTYINLLDDGENTVEEIGVRFESFPYRPHSQIKKETGYDNFISNKNCFGEMLLEKTKKKGLIAKSRNTKLLVMTLPIKAPTIHETVQNIQKQFKAIEECIEETIHEMQIEGLIK